ncbi:MAG: hypothetical protein FWG66_09670 [Spirochaetes bacterium]|nr:hypothetical protein [Spirochaetota bacterium]
MTTEEMEHLKGTLLAPYIQLSTVLIGKSRESGGNMFRHQLDTMAILIDYHYINSVLLKAAIVHDVLEDVPDFNHNTLMNLDYEGHEVYSLVREVTRIPGEEKSVYLTRVHTTGSHNAKILKVADRISNMISLGFVNDMDFVKRYTDETENYILPIAREIDKHMVTELLYLIDSRRNFLDQPGGGGKIKELVDSTNFL